MMKRKPRKNNLSSTKNLNKLLKNKKNLKKPLSKIHNLNSRQKRKNNKKNNKRMVFPKAKKANKITF